MADQQKKNADIPSGERVSPLKNLTFSKAAWSEKAQQILTFEALEFIAALHRRLGKKRLELLAQRKERQAAFDRGELPGYLDSTSEAVAGTWKIAPLPKDLLTRRVEITGPVSSAKMVINMLSRNSEGARADCAMVDFEDSMKPAWEDVVNGVHNVIGVVDGTLSLTDGEKTYRVNPQDMAVLMVRCRGLHLTESNCEIDGEPISGGLFDLGLCFFHTAKKLLQQGKTPAYYVPKCEHFLEARWWNELFCAVEDGVGVPRSTLRATFLIETLPAAFQMEEILYEIRDHAAGLNGGRWDKIFSDIKTLRYHKDRVMADRASISMATPWMARYVERMIKICHARGAFAMGGMSAFTPGKTPEIREQQTAKVMADKQHEASIGHDGCWVSHPYFIGRAMAAFKNNNQLNVMGEKFDKFPDLLPQGGGPRTLQGLRTNVRVGIAYMHGWQHGLGCIAWDNLMEDLATLEISRAQVWQWLQHEVSLDDGTRVTREFVHKIFDEELARIESELNLSHDAEWKRAMNDSRELFMQKDFPEFFSMASEIAK